MTIPAKFVQPNERRAVSDPISKICPTAVPVRTHGVNTTPAGDAAGHTCAVATKGWTR